MRTPLVASVPRQATQARHGADGTWASGGPVHHSDTGSQYTSVVFTAELLEAGITGSIGTVGDALDNAMFDSTMGLFKTEAINDGGPTWADRRAVEWQVARWVAWYNSTWLHSSVGHLPPVEFEQRHRQAETTTSDLGPRPAGRLTNHPPANPRRFGRPPPGEQPAGAAPAGR